MKQRLGLGIDWPAADSGFLTSRRMVLIRLGIHEIRTLIRSLPQNMTAPCWFLLIYFPEVELMADDIGILNHGHLLFEGTMEDLKNRRSCRRVPDR